MIDGMEATLLGDVLAYGRCIALRMITEARPAGRQVDRTFRIDPECFHILAGLPVIEHSEDCTCDRPWHPARGPKPAQDGGVWDG